MYEGFNTASGRCFHSILFVCPSLWSGTRDVRTSSSLRSSAASHPSSHTASGRCCCNCLMEIMEQYLVVSFNTASGRCCCNVYKTLYRMLRDTSFNTASGRCCCNTVSAHAMKETQGDVSIPQAVGAVATNTTRSFRTRCIKFQYRKR